jgi:hypothetical protein
MPRGNPKKFTGVRLDPALLAEVQERAPNVSAAIEEGLALWLKRERRKDEQGATKPKAKPKADPLAKRLAPPTARERAVRRRA